MKTDSDPGWVRGSDSILRVAVPIFFSLVLIFYIDILTPLGLSVWILYFIPLFLTLYLDWRYGSFVVCGLIILLTYASYFFSPMDISPLFALMNRVFFTFLITVSAIVIGHYKQNIERLQKSEENYRILAEWSPDAILVSRDGAVQYANLAFLRSFTTSDADNPIGSDVISFVQPASRDLVQQRIRQAEMGARIEVSGIPMIRPGGHVISSDLSVREVLWEDSPAVLMVIRQSQTP